jgi:hypothetical protein
MGDSALAPILDLILDSPVLTAWITLVQSPIFAC